MVFKDLCILALWTKVASALERLIQASGGGGGGGGGNKGFNASQWGREVP